MKKTHKIVLHLNEFIHGNQTWLSTFKWVLLTVPTTLVAWANSRTDVLWQKPLKEWFEAHPYIFLLCFVVPAIASIIILLYNQAANQIIPSFASKGLKLVLTVHSRYFEDKFEQMRRCYYDQCGQRRSSRITPNHLFNCAIKPDEAIRNLIKEICLYLQDDFFNKEPIKVVLAACEHGSVTDYKAFHPTGSSHLPSKKVLKNPADTFFNFVINTKSTQIIENIEYEISSDSKRYLTSENPSHNKGSIIGIPIFNTVTCEIAFVLTIKSDTPDTINSFNKLAIEAICDPFCRWIMFERQLELIADRVNT